MSTQPDETTGPRPPYLVQRRDHDGAILVGSLVYAADEIAARARAGDACALQTRDSWGRQMAEWVLAFLDGADQRTQHAEQVAAFPDQAPTIAWERQQATAPRPTAPPVELRLHVDVARVETAVVLVRVPPAQLADDPANATQDATRALHDAALALVRVLVVEPAERDRS